MHERAVRGRVIARLLLLLALALVSVLILLYVAQPNYIEPLYSEPPVWERLLMGAAILAIAVGLIWMIRIDREARDPERHRSSWRSGR